jgi:hypothetical protein
MVKRPELDGRHPGPRSILDLNRSGGTTFAGEVVARAHSRLDDRPVTNGLVARGRRYEQSIGPSARVVPTAARRAVCFRHRSSECPEAKAVSHLLDGPSGSGGCPSPLGRSTVLRPATAAPLVADRRRSRAGARRVRATCRGEGDRDAGGAHARGRRLGVARTRLVIAQIAQLRSERGRKTSARCGSERSPSRGRGRRRGGSSRGMQRSSRRKRSFGTHRR